MIPIGSPAATSRTVTVTDTEAVAIVSQSVAQRVFPRGEAVNRHLWLDSAADSRENPARAASSGWSPTWTTRTYVQDADDDSVPPVVGSWASRAACSSAPSRPYALVPAVTRTLRDISADQAVERPATLEDVRTPRC